MTTELDLLRRWLSEPGGGMISRPHVSAALRDILPEIIRIAGLRTDEETEGGLSGDDAVQELGAIIEWARRHSANRPDPASVYQHPDDADDHIQKAARALSHSTVLSPELRGKGPDDAYAKLVDGFRSIEAQLQRPSLALVRFAAEMRSLALGGRGNETADGQELRSPVDSCTAVINHASALIDRAGADPTFADVMRDQAKPQGPNCRACNGTGEVIEYPADEDERIVACSACGGTGEDTAI